MKVRLNLATKPLETHRRFLAASGVVAAIAGVAFLALGWHVYAVRKANSEFRARQDAVQRELQSLAALGIERLQLALNGILPTPRSMTGPSSSTISLTLAAS